MLQTLISWGWRLNDVYRFDTPMAEWFPVWFGNLRWYLRFLFCINGALYPVMALAGLWRGIRKKDWSCLQIVAVMGACSGGERSSSQVWKRDLLFLGAESYGH